MKSWSVGACKQRRLAARSITPFEPFDYQMNLKLTPLEGVANIEGVKIIFREFLSPHRVRIEFATVDYDGSAETETSEQIEFIIELEDN